MYKKVSTELSFASREENVLKFWRENRIFEKSVAKNEKNEPYTFYDGPPTANGKPHIGHVLTRCIKDLFPRYKAMQGYDVLRKAGWDTHGLPVELEVEKALGLDGKGEIEKYGVEPFIAECKKSVWRYLGEWEKMSERVGYWVDMDKPYITYDNDYIESVWWSLKKIWEKGLLYKGHKVVPYCPRCGTALSSHEVAQGYELVSDPSIFIRFKLKHEDGYLLAWTTTPWTLLSNVALTVNAEKEYARVEHKGETLILAKALLDAVLGEASYKISKTFKGKELSGMEYEPLYPPVHPPKEKGWYVVCDDYVTLEDGTGIVHTAPAFGEDDAKTGQKYKLPFIQVVDPRGRFTDETPWAGKFVKDADPLIIEDLSARGLLFAQKVYEHNYPFCWRCETPLLYYARKAWFIRMTAVRDELIRNNRSVNWLPETIKEGRMGNFLENVIDWGLSRERYWGTPLPVWECGCGNVHAVGSIKELRELGENVPENIELHKPYIDRVELICQKCGGKMKRVPEVIDCWYDSGSMPFAQWHYPFENGEEFKKRFPAHFISEAIDQTRGWFYTLLAISTCLFGGTPFLNCIVLGHVQDREGRKMSKRLGNVIDPWPVLQKQGADAVRWYFYSASSPWLPNRFYEDAVSEVQRKFMGTLWNTYAFFVLYANIDSFSPKGLKPDKETLCVMDRWILSRLHSLIGKVREHLDAYHITEPAREIEKFVEELSNWYVRRGRERYWAGGMGKDKQDAYLTLYTVLETLTRLTAPFVPFISEEIYQNLVRSVDKDAPESVHLCSYPEQDRTFIDVELEKYMDITYQAVALGRGCRNMANIKNRQPLSKIHISSRSDIPQLPEMFLNIIREELNVKEVDYTDYADRYIDYFVKPNLKTVGPKYGKLLPAIKKYLETADGKDVKDSLVRGVYEFKLENTIISLRPEDLFIESKPKEGYINAYDAGVVVILEGTLTESLIEEGFVNEIISKVQTMRKEAGFEVTNHIALFHCGNETISGVIERNKQDIAKAVLADRVEAGCGNGYKKEWEINGEKGVCLVVEKL
ncbi:MAG: isoleucine--tRNA ligase [Bacillota bacterium]|nr:isoleucine--tRNA ligase [Bacillota bacterium]